MLVISILGFVTDEKVNSTFPLITLNQVREAWPSGDRAALFELAQSYSEAVEKDLGFDLEKFEKIEIYDVPGAFTADLR